MKYTVTISMSAATVMKGADYTAGSILGLDSATGSSDPTMSAT